jgi:hypothetical protein
MCACKLPLSYQPLLTQACKRRRFRVRGLRQRQRARAQRLGSAARGKPPPVSIAPAWQTRRTHVVGQDAAPHGRRPAVGLKLRECGQVAAAGLELRGHAQGGDRFGCACGLARPCGVGP